MCVALRNENNYGVFEAHSPEIGDCVIEIHISGFGDSIIVLKNETILFELDTVEFYTNGEFTYDESVTITDYSQSEDGFCFEFSPYLNTSNQKLKTISIHVGNVIKRDFNKEISLDTLSSHLANCPADKLLVTQPIFNVVLNNIVSLHITTFKVNGWTQSPEDVIHLHDFTFEDFITFAEKYNELPSLSTLCEYVTGYTAYEYTLGTLKTFPEFYKYAAKAVVCCLLKTDLDSVVLDYLKKLNLHSADNFIDNCTG